MSLYRKLSSKPKLFLSVAGISLCDFQRLLPDFEHAFRQRESERKLRVLAETLCSFQISDHEREALKCSLICLSRNAACYAVNIGDFDETLAKSWLLELTRGFGLGDKFLSASSIDPSVYNDLTRYT